MRFIVVYQLSVGLFNLFKEAAEDSANVTMIDVTKKQEVRV